MHTKNCSLFTAHCSLIFIHGWATDSWIWKHQIDEFSKDYDVLTIDLPGHGANGVWPEPTLKPAVKEVLEIVRPILRMGTPKSQIVNPIGIGWSLGGQVLLETAFQHPDLFKGIILVASSPCFTAKKDFPCAQPAGIAKRMLKDVKKDFMNTIKRFYPLNFTQEELAKNETQQFITYYEKQCSTFHRDSMAQSLEALLCFDIRERLRAIKTPALIIQGGKDNVCHPGAAPYLAENLGNAKTEIICNAGHAPMMTRHKELNEIIRGFIEV